MKINISNNSGRTDAPKINLASQVEPTEEKPKRRVKARINNKPKLVEEGLMKSHNFMSSTEATLTRIYPLTPLGKGQYEIEAKEGAVSTILKMVIKTNETNPMSLDWSHILWNATQQHNILEPDVLVTFTRHFERIDDESAKKRIKSRSRLATVSSGSKTNVKAQNTFLRHDQGLIHALDTGDSIVAFGAEAIITAPDEKSLEIAMSSLQNYLKVNDETRGLHYELDINKQLHPFILSGPNLISKNKDVYTEMTSTDASISALFVDSGGDRTEGSEYIGLSIGKMIRSHAAYPLMHRKIMVVGNNTIKDTHTLAGDNMDPRLFKMPSTSYLSQAISRAYLLNGNSVTHFVLDNTSTVEELMRIDLNDENKMAIDVSKGFLNILEVIGDMGESENPERLIGRYTAHINNIITLFGQFRNIKEVSTTDDFSSIARKILNHFFIANKYYVENPRANLDQIRLFGNHDQYKTLADLGQWIAQQRKSNRDRQLEDALAELDIIINNNILPTIPSLNTKTDPVVDDFMDAKFRVVDLTGLSIGSITSNNDSTTNVMMMAYLNILIPSLKNGDSIVIHGLDKVANISEIIHDMINSAQGIDLDIAYIAKGQTQANKVKDCIVGSVDFTMVDLYNNRIDTLLEPLEISKSYAKSIEDVPSAFFIKTLYGTDYVLLDSIL